MNHTTPSWKAAFASYLDRRALTMSLLGFSAGLPILLIFSSLSLWLREAGVDRDTVTLFSWAALGYSFKFIWAPLIDILPLPFLTKLLGRRRSWLLLAQLFVMLAIIAMGSVNPALEGELTVMAFLALLLGFSAATQDIVIDAYRIESADVRMQSALSACYTAGYRIGMIAAGAGALYLATFLGATEESYNYLAWRHTYWGMALLMLVGVITCLFMPEPVKSRELPRWTVKQYSRLVLVFILVVLAFVLSFWQLGVFAREILNVEGFFIELARLILAIAAAALFALLTVQVGLLERTVANTTWVEPVMEFFRRYGKKALLLLALIGLYRISDIVAGVISNVFYQDMGFTKNEIATAVKTVGVVMTIIGGFAGGLLAHRYDVMKMLFVGGLLACMTNLLFVALAMRGEDTVFLYIAVIADNLAAGLASAVFIAFLSALTSVKFTAVQYAIFSSLMTMLPKVLGGYSGGMVDAMGYPLFFTFTALLGFPVLLLVYGVAKHIPLSAAK